MPTIDRTYFRDRLSELYHGSFEDKQIKGVNAILDEWDKSMAGKDLRWLAYMLATTFHETAHTMYPVREAFWKSEEWRKNNLSRYYPYYGRGYVQITWEENYRRLGQHVNRDLVKNPDIALELDVAAAAMFVGMEQGWFRGDAQGRHTLARYFSHTKNDPVGARKIVNGKEIKKIHGEKTLMADVIAGYYKTFLESLRYQ